jgi:serine/threonine protein kinase
MLRKKIGEFYLVKRLGSGLRSEVYLGINPHCREKRIYRFLGKRGSIGAFAYGRFIRDVNVLRSLSHPGIIKVIDSGVFDDRCYFSMDFVPGGNLAQRLERGKMPVADAMALFVRISRAMAYAHEQGIIHGDLRPGHILIDASGEPVISDFQIAWMPDPQCPTIGRSCKCLESIAYVSPEQRCSSNKANRRTDVFALGAILYHMVMGFPPLGNFPKPIDSQPDFPATLGCILEKCMSVDADRRFDDAITLTAQLEGTPVYPEARTWNPGLGAQFRRFPHEEEGPAWTLKTDRIEAWLRILRTGTTRERLAIVREMVDTSTPAEAKTIVKIYSEEEDRVRWGLIRVLGELKVEAATQLILNDLNGSFYTECAIEALGKIGSSEAYNPIREFIAKNPDNALIALLPLAQTGKRRAIKTLGKYLPHESPVMRQAAVRALASIECAEALVLLKEHLCVESNEQVRSTLIQVVHSLQRTLHPALRTSLNEAAAAARPGVA